MIVFLVGEASQVSLTFGQPLGQADVLSDVLPHPITPYALYPYPQYRHLVAKSSTTSGQIDIWSAFRSG